MDGTNADSDHSMTWEDFFGSTTDLAPTLIGLYDSLLEPGKSSGPEASRFDLSAKDARDDPPMEKPPAQKTMDDESFQPPKNPNRIKEVRAIQSSLYSERNKEESPKSARGYNGRVNSSESTVKSIVSSRIVKHETTSKFDNLSPNVKRMISSATDTSPLKFQKKGNAVRNSLRGSKQSNIPLVGATSKISQTGVDILPSVEIYDQPCKAQKETESEEQLKPNFKIDDSTYDVPKSKKVVYDTPVPKTAFECLSLPFIDQSLEHSTADREFDTKLTPNSPEKSPSKLPKMNGVRNSSPLKSEPYSNGVSLKSEKLKPPVVEVSRPLSMSSIASSSSTSSSGAQNKGVNSAYLASIESLDDHSDADLPSANGSNNFVNNAGLNVNASEERADDIPHLNAAEGLPGLSQLERVCAEIVQTEIVYVEDLRQVVEGYLHVWRDEVLFSKEELSELFNNIEDIYAFNSSLCTELSTCQLDAICIARCFVKNTAGFAVYTSYCTGYPRTMERLAALASKPHSAKLFRDRQTALGHPLPLASYLLKPVQRILKYHLLLQNVVKQCASPDTEYALLKMTGIAQHIDDMKRIHEHAVRVQEIQSLLYGWSGQDLTTYGELCAEGTFRVFGAKAMRHVFLFDKMLLVTKNREDGILAYKSHIMCNNMMLVESISGAALSFHVIPWDSPRGQLTLQARSPRHKREWTLLLKRVILENYNAVIPSHARQLVMELGQNKTDDDMLAEKSHNLITQASMRKQLSAPEYLEKRKLDRDRRKSFENSTRGRVKKSRKYTLPNTRAENSERCDCAQYSAEKGIDYTCDTCYIDLCSDCEMELSKDNCNCKNDNEKCPECDKALHYIDAGSNEQLERKQSSCKCSDFKSSQESVKEFPLNKSRGYHSSDSIIGYTENKVDVQTTKTCLKCAKIKENIAVTSLNTLRSRKSRFHDDKRSTLRSKSKDDPQRSKLSKIGTWRRKSEPGLQQNVVGIVVKKNVDNERGGYFKGQEKIEFECRNCGSNRINKKSKDSALSESEHDKQSQGKHNVEIKMYNSKNLPKKISKLKKNRAKGLRLGSDTTAKFYAELSTDVSTENILHITESNDSIDIATEKPAIINKNKKIMKDYDMDDETYKKLIEKTDSFKKNELERVKYLNKQKVINEGSETEEVEVRPKDEVAESCEEGEQPLEQIISQLLMQNREFQKLLKKQQLRNSAHRRHQRLLKSHSNPEQTLPSRSSEIATPKPKFGRQISENVTLIEKETQEVPLLSPQNELEHSEDEHIYETLRIEPKVDTIDANFKTNETLNPEVTLSPTESTKTRKPDSDYVYLSFEKLNRQIDGQIDGIYDVPIKIKKAVPIKKLETDYYVTVENNGFSRNIENVYDNLIEVTRRKKEAVEPGDYLPMGPDINPSNPEIWLNRQKEHFNVPHDRKSGSLPRSFQIITGTTDDSNLTTFKSKSNGNKTYLNKDGKVLNTDRPFTIASDKSEISFDDVESYMSERDIPKYNKSDDMSKNISQSTLELEKEIDRCYKNNFENLDANKNENLLNTSENNISVTSSCEVLPESNIESQDTDVIHPEHKIYKPTTNVLSLKNVLSRFKSKNTYKNSNDESSEINANEQSSPESAKSDVKSPVGNEKRSGLNPRSYSKNLLQRFRSIIGDEQPDDNLNKAYHKTKSKDSDANRLKSDIKVVITTTDTNPNVSVINDDLSKSVYEQTTLTESQNEKNNLDQLSHSCDNISKPPDRPSYEKSVSMITTITTSAGNNSPSKSNSSYQSLNKLPIYMQGSRSLGARIAQSDYVDPTTLDKSGNSSINVLINRNSIRPDSLFSNSSFVTLSSESTSHTDTSSKYTTPPQVTNQESQENSDESYYEKSFEKIEHITDQDVFRDSAVYSDQEDGDEKKQNKTLKDTNNIKRDTKTSTTNSTSTYSRVTVKIQQEKSNLAKPQSGMPKPKIAPPVPTKPKTITKTFTKESSIQQNVYKRHTSLDSRVEAECLNKIKKPTAPALTRSESASPKSNSKLKEPMATQINDSKESHQINEIKSSIQMKRMSFERITDPTPPLNTELRKSEIPKVTSKTVLERRMEIESKTRTTNLKKPSQLTKPKPVSKVSFQKSVEETKTFKEDIPNQDQIDSKESWVKQVVNKFQ